MSRELEVLAALAKAMGVHTSYVDGLDRPVEVSPDTLVRVCAALGAEITAPADAAAALKAYTASKAARHIPPVLVAWEGVLGPLLPGAAGPLRGEIRLEDGSAVPLDGAGGQPSASPPLPFGYHRLVVETDGRTEKSTVIAAPERTWHRERARLAWGVGAHLAALRSSRSRSLGDLRDLEILCRWIASHGGDLVTVLPLLPTFNDPPAEPSPYAPVSRLFWSELVLAFDDQHRAAAPIATLDVTHGDAEVRSALAEVPAPGPATLETELQRYARFRGAQARLGRNWRSWPEGPRLGRLGPADVDPDEERFHLVAQSTVRRQLKKLKRRIREDGVRLGLDLSVGVHPDGYDPWSRPYLFADTMSVGAPPDRGFPSGQDWGFSPVLPEASRREGHRYVASSIAHQAILADVVRVDHIMALTRLYWIPHGFDLHQGTYVTYPAEELFAVLTLESHRNACEIVGENLGTVPPEVNAALPRHGIHGTYLAQFAPPSVPPSGTEVAHFGTHDTPTVAGWVAGVDIDERVRYGLLDPSAAPEVRHARTEAIERLSATLDVSPGDVAELLGALLDWLGSSPSPLVIPWLEDLWLEVEQVNLPGTTSSERPNWQRPMARLLDDVLNDPTVIARVRRLNAVREAAEVVAARLAALAAEAVPEEA